MKTIQHINGNLIEDIYTKFYYLNEQLCYQIVVNYDKGKILLKDFSKYDDYKYYHNLLINAINNKKQVDIDLSVMKS